MPNQSEFAPDAPDAAAVGPTDAEVEAWAERERARRDAWLRGPTEAQKAEWAAAERARRTRPHLQLPAPSPETRHLAQHYLRSAQLVAEGAFSRLFNLSARDVLDDLIRAGRAWEDEYTSGPALRRRVPLEPEPPQASARPASETASQST